MPTFRVISHAAKRKRRREDTLRAFDEATAREIAAADGNRVVESVELVKIPASQQLRNLALALGLSLTNDACHIEAVILILMELAAKRRKARITCSTTIDGIPFRPIVEPYELVRSKEGFRLRCWVYEVDPTAEVISDFETAGWHHYLLDEIEAIEDTGEAFEYRPDRKLSDDDLVIRIVANLPEEAN